MKNRQFLPVQRWQMPISKQPHTLSSGMMAPNYTNPAPTSHPSLLNLDPGNQNIRAAQINTLQYYGQETIRKIQKVI